MHTLSHNTPSKRFGIYVALSLILHAILLNLWQVPPPRSPILPTAPAIVFDLAQPTQETASLPSPPLVQAPQKAISQPIAPVATQIKKEEHPEAEPDASPSIMFTRSSKPSDALGLSRALPTFGASGPDTSGFALAKNRLDDLVRKYKKPLQASKPKNEWVPTLALTAREGTAFYAAYAAHNAPAMLAVTGLSLTGGVLRKGIGKTVSAIRNAGRHESVMANGEVILLAHIAQHAPITARDLYMTLPAGWTYVTLKKHLDKLVKEGSLTRFGKGHQAQYHID